MHVQVAPGVSVAEGEQRQRVRSEYIQHMGWNIVRTWVSAAREDWCNV
jgi:hypothetical protein